MKSPWRETAPETVQMSLISENDFGVAENFHVSVASPSDYLALLKPRVMSLVIFTALTGLLIAPSHVNPVVGFASLLAIAIGAGASGALNMWYDADIDALMRRTQSGRSQLAGCTGTMRSVLAWCCPCCR